MTTGENDIARVGLDLQFWTHKSLINCNWLFIHVCNCWSSAWCWEHLLKPGLLKIQCLCCFNFKTQNSDRMSNSSQCARGSKRNKGSKARDTKRRTGDQNRPNKLYRTPPTPPPDELWAKEKGFISDNVAIASISVDYAKQNPKVGQALPPYNSQQCAFTKQYFRYNGVDRTLRKNGQVGSFLPPPLVGERTLTLRKIFWRCVCLGKKLLTTPLKNRQKCQESLMWVLSKSVTSE